MKNYYSIEGRLYTLTNKQVKELNKLYPYNPKIDTHSEMLIWIEKNGTLIGSCQNLAY